MSNSSDGRLPASVYRRRRITVAIVALVLVGLIAWGVSAVVSLFGPQEQPPAAEQTTTQGTDKDPTVEKTPASKACTGDEVSISASTDQRSYAPEENPVLTLGIENTSKRDCELNVGTSQQEFLIASGSDRIFSTVDCLDNPEDVKLMLEPGQKENAKFQWDRTRSAPGCKAVSSQPRPGTYKFTAAIGEFVSDPATFELK